MPDPTTPERCRCHNREGLKPGQHENDCPLASEPVPEHPTPPDDTAPDLSNVDWSQAVVCYTRCWSCQFGYHQKPPKAHTWMDQEDAEHAGHPWPLPPEVAAAKQCACSCAKPKESRS